MLLTVTGIGFFGSKFITIGPQKSAHNNWIGHWTGTGCEAWNKFISKTSLPVHQSSL